MIAYLAGAQINENRQSTGGRCWRQLRKTACSDEALNQRPSLDLRRTYWINLNRREELDLSPFTTIIGKILYILLETKKQLLMLKTSNDYLQLINLILWYFELKLQEIESWDDSSSSFFSNTVYVLILKF